MRSLVLSAEEQQFTHFQVHRLCWPHYPALIVVYNPFRDAFAARICSISGKQQHSRFEVY